MSSNNEKAPMSVVDVVRGMLQDGTDTQFLTITNLDHRFNCTFEVVLLDMQDTNTGQSVVFRECIGNYRPDGATIH